MRITSLTTDHLRIPLGKPGRVPLGGPKAAGPDAVDLLLVHADTDAGAVGLGFTYLLGPGVGAVRDLLDEELPALVVGEDPHDTDRLFARAGRRFAGVGFAGLAARAYAAIDLALWDLKGQAAGLPLHRLLGGVRPAAPFFLSDLAPHGRPAEDVLADARPFVRDGAMGVRVEVGRGDVQEDADRVRDLSDGLGDGGWVGVSAGGRFDLNTAVALAHFFGDIGVDWFEDPLPAGDDPGYRRLADLAEVPLAVGSLSDSTDQFIRVIREGVIRTVRPDVCRLGGITPVLKVAAVAEAFGVAVSPVRLPEVGVHLACGLAAVPHVDSVGWFADVFGGPRLQDGKLIPPDGPGLGLHPNGGAVERYRVR
jgi:L-alanine-DL-glutamate epimerase-like enolase superfamily enzyme